GGAVEDEGSSPGFKEGTTTPPSAETGGSVDFGAVETADPDEPVDATAPVAPVERIGIPCWPCNVEVARKLVDPVNPARTPALLPREPPPPRCALAESMVSASAARAATRISDGLRSRHVNMMAPSDTIGEPSGHSRAPVRPSTKVLMLLVGADEVMG